MNTQEPPTEEVRLRLSIGFFLVAINPCATFSIKAVASAIGCSEDAVQTLVDEGTIPAAFNGEASPSECVQVPRPYVTKLLFLMAQEAPEDFVARTFSLSTLLSPEHLDSATTALKDLLKTLK